MSIGLKLRRRGLGRRRTQLLYAAESLEARQMLATYNGTNGNDIIQIQLVAGFNRVIINGGFNTTSDTAIVINCLDGVDRIDVSGMKAASDITVNGGSGDDFIQNIGHDLDVAYPGLLTFNGDAGTDGVIADNQSDTDPSTEYRITGPSLFDNGEQRLRYFTVENLDFGDNDLANTISFTSMQGSGNDLKNVVILGNGGNDRITNAVTTSSNTWATSVSTTAMTINGGAGTDTLDFRNESGPGATTTTITANTFDITSPTRDTGLVNFLAAESLSVTGSGSADTIRHDSKSPTMPVTVNGGNGNDTFVVGGGDLDTNNFFTNPQLVALGGGGTDVIRFDDHLDAPGGGETESYTFGGVAPNGGLNTLAKTPIAIVYDEFESQILDAADGGVAPGATNFITFGANLNPSAPTASTVNGGAVRSCSVRIGDTTLDTIVGGFTIALGAASGAVHVIDTSSSTARLYRMAASGLTSPLNVAYSGTTAFSLNTGSGSDTFEINGTPVGGVIALNGNDGSHTATIGGGDFETNIRAPVMMNGGTAGGSVIIDNTLDAVGGTHSLNGVSFNDNQAVYFDNVLNLTIREGPGAADLAINSVADSMRVTVEGGSGNDKFTIGSGDLDMNLQAGIAQTLKIDGKGGADSIRFNDLNDLDSVGANGYRFENVDTLTDRFAKRIGTIDYLVEWTSISDVTLDASNAPSTPSLPSQIDVLNSRTALFINGNAGSDRISVADSFSLVFVNTGLGDADTLIVNGDFGAGDTPVTVEIRTNDDIELLDIKRGGTLRVASGATVLKTKQDPGNSFFGLAGTLDVQDGSFISRFGDFAASTFGDMIKRGYNGGAWNGVGLGTPIGTDGAINSSLAASTSLGDGVGYGSGFEVAPTTSGPFTIDASDIVLRYTLNGDTNLDRSVNFADLLRLAQSYGTTAFIVGWAMGDFDYDADVDFANLLSLAQNYGQTLSMAPTALAAEQGAASRRNVSGSLAADVVA